MFLMFQTDVMSEMIFMNGLGCRTADSWISLTFEMLLRSLTPAGAATSMS